MLSALILLIQFSFAQVEDAGWYTRVQGRLGGENQCTPATTAEALQLDCNINNYNFRGDVTPFADEADNLTEEIFFQSVAERSHSSSRCHREALNLYTGSPAETARINQWGLDAFRSVEEELRHYMRLKADYESELSSRRMAIDHHDVSEAQWNSRRRMLELQGKIGEIKIAVKSLTARIPLGNHKDVSEALAALVERDSVSDADFRRVYRAELEELRNDIDRSVRYFDEHRNANGTYQVDKDLKIMFANSGQVDVAFETMAEKDVFSDGLQCRINSRYREGHRITEIFKMVALAGATLLASEIVIPVRAATAALSAASAAARITYMGAEFTLLALNGAIAATTLSDIARSCAGPTVLLTGQSDQNRSCNPQGRLNGMLQEASNAECAANILFTAAPGLVELRRGFLAARNVRLAREAPVVEVEEIVVTAQRRPPRGTSSRDRRDVPGESRRLVTADRAGAAAGGRQAVEAGSGRDAARRSGGSRAATDGERRTRFTEDYVDRTYATEAQNQRWIEIAEESAPGGSTRFFDVENSAMKHLNDTLLDKNFVTAVTNMHKEVMCEMMEALARRYPGVEFLPYSDFKAMRYAMRPRPPATALPSGLDDEIARAFRRANEEFAQRLSRQNLVPANENPANWFRAGFAETADEATLASRYARGGSGENRMRRFSDGDLQQNMEDARRMGELFRSNLQESFGGTALMEPSSVAGRLIPRREIFEAARKTRTTEELRQFILRTTGQDITPVQAGQLRSYTELVDEFSPGIHVATREVASLADSPAGGFSIDFAGMGAFNGQATADALAGSGDIQSALRGARASERRVTAMFNYRKTQVESIVGRVLNRHGIQADVVTSGDDMVVRPRTAIPPEVRQEIAAELAREIDPASVRMSHVGDSIESGSERMIMATIGEACEKWIRKAAQGVIAADRLSQTLMLVEVSGASSANFSTHLVLGEGNLLLTDSERGTLQRISGDAARAGCR